MNEFVICPDHGDLGWITYKDMPAHLDSLPHSFDTSNYTAFHWQNGEVRRTQFVRMPAMDTATLRASWPAVIDKALA